MGVWENVLAQSPCLSFPIQIFDSIQLETGYEHLAVDGQGNLYLLSEEEQSLDKWLEAYHFDSSFQVGGPSALPGENFLAPIALQVNNHQQVFLLDEASRSLFTWGKDLERLGQINFSTESNDQLDQDPTSPLLPRNFLINSLGEFYLINEWDNKIHHFNAEGNFLQSFGGTDYGEGNLFSPVYLSLTNKNDIFVYDSMYSQIYRYDAFGTFKNKYTIELPSTAEGMAIYGSHLFLWEGPRLHIVQFDPLFQTLCTYSFHSSIQDIAFHHKNLYILERDKISLYKKE